MPRRREAGDRNKKLRELIRWYFGTGSESLDYWQFAAKARGKSLDELADEYELVVPRPISATLDSWIAFLRVYDCRHISGMGVPTTPQWADIAARLSVHDLWTAELEEHLSLCFRELLTVEAEKRKESKEAVSDGRHKSPS